MIDFILIGNKDSSIIRVSDIRSVHHENGQTTITVDPSGEWHTATPVKEIYNRILKAGE